MLRHANTTQQPAGKYLPSMVTLTKTLSVRLKTWTHNLKNVVRREVRGEEVQPHLSEFCEGAPAREIIDRIGTETVTVPDALEGERQETRSRLLSLSATLLEGDLGAISSADRLAIFHILCELALFEDRDLPRRFDFECASPGTGPWALGPGPPILALPPHPRPSPLARRYDRAAQEAFKAKLLGRDAPGRWHYHFPSLDSRVYTMASAWKAAPLPPIPHPVKVGERIEVEVEEKRDGRSVVEWRTAEVMHLLAGGKGRFSAVVQTPEGEWDWVRRRALSLCGSAAFTDRGRFHTSTSPRPLLPQDFVEHYTAPLVNVEWRKVEPPPKPAASHKKRKVDEVGGDPPPPREPPRKTRHTDAPPKPPPAAEPKKPSHKKGAGAKGGAAEPTPVGSSSTSTEDGTFTLLELAPALARLKSSKARADIALRAVLAELAPDEAACDEREQAYARCWTAAVIRLHGEVRALEEKLAAISHEEREAQRLEEQASLKLANSQARKAARAADSECEEESEEEEEPEPPPPRGAAAGLANGDGSGADGSAAPGAAAPAATSSRTLSREERSRARQVIAEAAFRKEEEAQALAKAARAAAREAAEAEAAKAEAASTGGTGGTKEEGEERGGEEEAKAETEAQEPKVEVKAEADAEPMEMDPVC